MFLTQQLLVIIVALSSVGNTQETGNCSIHTPFNCTDGNGCINRFDNFCDGTPQCSDGSDEILYNPTLHQDDGIQCRVLKATGLRSCFLPNKYLCDHEIDCTLGEDECNCNHTFYCDSSPFGGDPTQCLARVQFCDNVQDCWDFTDEKKYVYGSSGHQCEVTKTRMTSTCVLPSRHVCDGTPDCDGGTDECFCNSNTDNTYAPQYINEHCFRCLDGEKVIPRGELCDGIFQCKDLSDECLCPSAPSLCEEICEVDQFCGQCEVGQLMCKQANGSTSAKCFNRTSVCDGHYDCPLAEDETHCGINFSELFYCDDQTTYIHKYQRCDNFSDCPDKSDEKNCSELLFECNPTSVYPNTVRKGTYENFRPRYTEACDQIPYCEDMEDECNNSLCGSPLPEYCNLLQGTTGFICPNTKSALIGSQICDGYPSCLETTPELSADELYCPDRFYCHDKGRSSLPIHIPLSSVCDTISDCNDHSDELNCSSETHFYCSSGFPIYIPKHKVCNNIQDCLNGEDECQNCSISPFSSDFFLINSYVLQVFIWIVGLFAVFGNIGVLVHNVVQFATKRGKLSVIAYNHRLLVTNLAVADLLLGIYLLSLGIVNTAYKNVYCRNDIQWRASMNCVGIGVIAVISIECSIMLLATMASMRLFLVVKPFNSVIRRRYIVISIIFSWIFAFSVALIPLAPSASDYFMSQVWYQNNPFLTLVDRQEMENFTLKLWSLEDNRTHDFTNNTIGSLTWNKMINVVSRLSSDFLPSLYLGYYSAHGVCLPRIFPDPSTDQSWRFSLFLITVNFVTFLLMLAMYIAIYRITTEKSKNVGRATGIATSTTLQHKISRIIFSNFCCWIPICIFAFISASGGYVSPEIYAVSAVVLLPINSAFNPLLYSDLPDLLWQKLIAPTRCGRWMESKKLAREPSVSRRSLSSNKRMSLQQTIRTNLHLSTIKSAEEVSHRNTDHPNVYENMHVSPVNRTNKEDDTSNMYETIKV